MKGSTIKQKTIKQTKNGYVVVNYCIKVFESVRGVSRSKMPRRVGEYGVTRKTRGKKRARYGERWSGGVGAASLRVKGRSTGKENGAHERIPGRKSWDSVAAFYPFPLTLPPTHRPDGGSLKRS